MKFNSSSSLDSPAIQLDSNTHRVFTLLSLRGSTISIDLSLSFIPNSLPGDIQHLPTLCLTPLIPLSFMGYSNNNGSGYGFHSARRTWRIGRIYGGARAFDTERIYPQRGSVSGSSAVKGQGELNPCPILSHKCCVQSYCA